MIHGIKSIKDAVKSVYALNAPAQLFAIHVKPLSAGKVQEKIKEDIVNTFKDNLYAEKIDVSFEVLKDVSVQEKESSPAQFRMALSKPLKKKLLKKH